MENYKNIILKVPSDWEESHLNVLFRPTDERITVATSDAEVLEHLDASGRTLVINCQSFENEGEHIDEGVCIGFNQDATMPEQEVVDFLFKSFNVGWVTVVEDRHYTNGLTTKVESKPFKQIFLAINRHYYLLNGQVNKYTPYAPMISCTIRQKIYPSLLEKNM